MASINDVVLITVVNGAKSVSQKGFGTLLFITDNVPTSFKDVFRIYTSTDSMTNDGFAAKDNAFIAATTYFAQTPRPAQIIIAPRTHKDTTTLDDWATCIGKINNVTSDWYALSSYSKDDTDILAIANCIETQSKFYGVSTSEAAVRDTVFDPASQTPDIASQLKKAGITRTFILFSGAATSFPECGWLGSGLSMVPGTATYAYKNIATIAVDSLTETQEQNIYSKNANTFEFLAGQNITRWGSTPDGNYIDIKMALDYISSRIQEAVYGLLVNSPKIPFTDSGIAAIENQIRGVINSGVELSIIDNFSISMPKSTNVSQQDKQKRLLENIYINLMMSGAIQKVSAQIIYQV